MSERCIKCDAPHNPARCKDCHVYGRAISMGRAGYAYRWHHDIGCSHYHPRYYPEVEQDKHQTAAGSKNSYDSLCGTTGVPVLECQHCWEAADHDYGDADAI
jgi:hypothetical protein